jgi:hypothetical protein
MSKKTSNRRIDQYKCHLCSKRLHGGSAYFNFGAVIDVSDMEKKRINESIMESFCDIGYHGIRSDDKDSAMVTIKEKEIIGGQQDISFCSLVCLREWLNGIVDYLEHESGQSKSSKSRGRHTINKSLLAKFAKEALKYER